MSTRVQYTTNHQALAVICGESPRHVRAPRAIIMICTEAEGDIPIARSRSWLSFPLPFWEYSRSRSSSPTTHAWRKIIMDMSFVEFLRAGGVNQQLRKELEPSELKSERESEREFEREPGTWIDVNA